MNEKSLENLKPFAKGDDPRRNLDGRPVGSFSLTKKIREYLEEEAPDGQTYGDKLKKAAVLRAISKSDTLMKEIWDRTDGRVPNQTDITSAGKQLTIIVTGESAQRFNVQPTRDTEDNSPRSPQV